MMYIKNSKLTLGLTLLVFLLSCKSKPNNNIDPVASLFSNTTISSNITFRTIGDEKLKLDVYMPSKRLGEPPWVQYDKGPHPTLLYFHGGGWRSGDKVSRSLEVLPYVEKGWVVVSANYRNLYKTSLPEIIGDCRSALFWLLDKKEKYNIDTDKIVLAGNSAGGHLAMMTALASQDEPYKTSKTEDAFEVKIAAVVNWYGISDVESFVSKWKDKQILKDSTTTYQEVYNLCSPINYINESCPPIISVHGEIDKIVRIEQSIKLHEKLNDVGLKNKLLTIPNRKHGDFNPNEMTGIYNEIWSFFASLGIE